MDFNEQLFDKIENYLKGMLSPEMTAAFEAEMAADPELAEMVELQRFEQEGMEYLVEKDLRQKVKEWETNPPTEDDKKNGGNPFWRYGLGILLLVAVGSVFIWINNSSINDPVEPVEAPVSDPELETPPSQAPEELEEKPPKKKRRDIADTQPDQKEPIVPIQEPNEPPSNNYIAMAETTYSFPDHLNSDLRSTDPENTQNVLSAGMKAFAGDKMENAITEFKKISKEQNPDEFDQAQEYLAHAYFKTKKFDQAVAIFRATANHAGNGNTTIDRAEWYLLLSLLPDYTKNKSEVDALLDKMTDPENYHNYEDKANQLKAKLSNSGN